MVVKYIKFTVLGIMLGMYTRVWEISRDHFRILPTTAILESRAKNRRFLYFSIQ